jgi:ribosome recycling factor
MRKNIESLIDEMKSKMSGYAVLLHYRFMNLCVKAEPVSLLSLTIVSDEGEEFDIEGVASASLANDYQFEIYPHDSKMVFNICKAIKETHPEFEIDIRTDNNHEESEPEDNQVIICTMPEVNKDRHDALMEGVGLLYDQCKAKLDANHTAYKAKVSAKLVGSSDVEIKEAEDKLEEIYKMHDDTCLQYKEAKEKEIEEAYQRYLTEQANKQAEADEKAAARGETAGQAFNINQEDE